MIQEVTCSRSRLPLTDDAGAVNFQLETVNICGQGIKWKIIRSTNGPPMVHHGSIYEQLDNMLLVTQMPGWTSFRSLDDRFNILLCSIYKEGTMSVRLGPNDSGNSSMMCVFFCSWSAPMELHLLHSEWTDTLYFGSTAQYQDRESEMKWRGKSSVLKVGCQRHTDISQGVGSGYK